MEPLRPVGFYDPAKAGGVPINANQGMHKLLKLWQLPRSKATGRKRLMRKHESDL